MPRLLDSSTGVFGILDRPVEPGDDGWGVASEIRRNDINSDILGDPAARAPEVLQKQLARKMPAPLIFIMGSTMNVDCRLIP